MFSNRTLNWSVLLIVTLALVIGFAAVALAQTNSPAANRAEVTQLNVDVAEDATRFVFDQDVTHENGYPAYGGTFITQGYIYPEGTLDGTNGVLEDGSPEFPDLVLGEWTCRGWFVNDGLLSESGPVAITTQIFQFGEEYGHTTLITEGYEPIEPNVPFSRAITGGTGPYRVITGQVVQELLGMTDYMGVNLRFQFQLEEAVTRPVQSQQQ